MRVARKVTDVKLYDTLCNNNNWVQFKLRQLKKRAKDPEVKLVLNECLDILRFMKEQGQHMEARLRKWNDWVTEEMGYQRVRK